MRVGEAIGSAALVADGAHARADGLTSLGVVVGAIGVLAGFPRSDAIVGLLITVAIGYTLVTAAGTVLRRVLDGIDEPTMRLIETSAAAVAGVEHVSEARARWVGHQLRAELAIDVSPDISVEAGHDIAEHVRAALLHDVPRLGDAMVHVDPHEHDSHVRQLAATVRPSLPPHPRTMAVHMDETSLPPPPATGLPEYCYRHPNVETGVHCTRCGKPICPECMIPAPVGHQCPDCVDEARREFRQGPGRRIAAANVRRQRVGDHGPAGDDRRDVRGRGHRRRHPAR